MTIIPIYYPDIISDALATSIVVLNTVTLVDTAAFQPTNFPLLTSVVFMDDSICTTLGYAGFANSQLTNLVLPDSITIVGQAACKNMDFLTSITLGQIPVISDYMFQDCNVLTSIQLPNSVTSIGLNAFHNCYLLNQVLYSSVTSIAAYAFRNCLALKSFVVLASVLTIDDTAFFDCSNLTLIVCFNPNLMTQLQTMLPNATVQSYANLRLGVEPITYVNKLQNTIVYGRFRNSDDVTARNIECDAVFDRNVDAHSLTVITDATIMGTLRAQVLTQNNITLDNIFVAKLKNYQTIATAVGKTYSKEYTATLIKSGIGLVTSQAYVQNITLPANCWKIDVALFGSGGLSGTRTTRCGEGTGSGGNVVYMRNLMLVAGTVLILTIRPGMQVNTTSLFQGTAVIAYAANGNNGTSSTTTVIGVSGLQNIASWGAVAPNYTRDSTFAYGTSGQPPPAYVGGLVTPLAQYRGGYSAGNGGSTNTVYSATVSSSYGPGSIGGGQSSMTEYQVSPVAVGYKYDLTYKSGGAIITYYLK